MLATAVLAALLAGCSSTLGAPEAVTEQGDEFVTLWKGFLITAAMIGLLVYGLIIYAALRFRRRKGDDPTEVPPQYQYQVPLEVVYTVVPVLIVAVLFAVTVVSENRITRNDPDPALTVEVIGFQWQWQFNYLDPSSGETVATVSGSAETTPELVLPVGRNVRFDLVANDVIHSFWVPEFLEKRDLIPGIDNEIDVTPTEEGTFVGRCAEFCGLDHWRMNFKVRVVSAEEYEEWVTDAGGTFVEEGG